MTQSSHATPRRVLTEAFIRALRPAPQGQRYAVSDALVPSLRVRVTDKGTKTFVLWRRTDPRAKSASALALGTVGVLTLADARTKARSWLAQIAAGTDPREAERSARANTVAAAVELFLQRHVAGQRKAKAVERELRAELVTRWGSRPLSAITRRQVIAMVDEIVDRGARAQARNVLGHCKVFFGWCVEKDMLPASPAAGIRPARLVGPKVARVRVLNDEELRALWVASAELGYPVGPAVRMLLLTGQRKSEVTMSRWCEFDLPGKLWTIPAERFKSQTPHIVPLSDAMLTLLATLPRWRDGDFLFSSNGGRTPATGFNRGKRQLAAAIGAATPWVTHDIRRTMRTRLSALRVPEHVAELVIGHAKRGLARVYDQHRYAEEMRAALAAWAGRLQSIISPPAAPENVVPLGVKRP